MAESLTNIEEVAFNLAEMASASEKLLQKLKQGQRDAAELECDFEHILTHLCAAWNVGVRRTTEASQANCPDAIYLEVPNWQGHFTLVDAIEPK